MIRFCTNDSPFPMLFFGVYLKYFQGFSTCIFRLAGKTLPASFWAVLYSFPFPWLTNSVQPVFCQIPSSLKKKKGAHRLKKTEGPQFCKPPHVSRREITLPQQNHHHNKNKITEENCPLLPIGRGC